MSHGKIPWHRRVGVRAGVSVALLVLVVDLAYRELSFWMTSEDSSRAEFERVLEHYERTGEIEWFSSAQRWSMLSDSVVFAVLLACFAAWLYSRLATRRLTRLARAASAPVTADRLPGPFEVGGADEVTLLATSLNAMRGRVIELLEQLESRDVERREWIAQVSHDLRTPLTAMGVGLERAQQQLARGEAGSSAEALALVTSVAHDVTRVQTLAADLLEIARLEAGEALRLEPVPVGELIQGTVEGLRPVAESRQVDLRARDTSGLPTLEADGHRLQRALENLLANALRHAGSRVEVGAERLNGRIHVWVTDDGPGFPEEPGELTLEGLAKIPRQAGSSGIGLQVAVRVAAAHGGTLHAHHPATGGVKLTLTLPDHADGGPSAPNQLDDQLEGLPG